MPIAKLLKRSFLWTLGLALVAGAPLAARAACDCGSKDPAAPCTGTTVGRTVGGATLELTVNCNGRACQCGQFPLGEYWVAPIDDQGVKVQAVQVTAMHADVSAATANPTAHGGGQGLIYASREADGTAIDAAARLKRWGYKASLDVRTQLPYRAAAGTSILNVKTGELNGPPCGPYNGGVCVIASDVVSVLATVPPGAGSTVLRPPFAGAVKPLYPTSQLALSKIPRYALVRTSWTWDKKSYAQIVRHWDQPFYDLCLTAAESYLCRSNDVFRAFFSTSSGVRGYGADLASGYYGSLAVVMDDAAMTGDKRRAVYALFQRGMDLYWQMKAGSIWSYGGGQGAGRKGPIVFFAALVNDKAILSEVQKLSTAHPDWFQETKQIMSTTCAGDILWGDRGGWVEETQERMENYYWGNLLAAQCFNGAVGPCDASRSSGRTFRDPYNYIDGPPVRPGFWYMSCCSTGTFLVYTMLQYMMPELRLAANDGRLIRFVEKHFLGLGGNSADPPHQTTVRAIVRPDPCAPPSARDAKAKCDIGRGTCLDYKKLWGPDPKRPGECIYHNGDPATDGRFGHLSDSQTRQHAGRVTFFVGQLWRNATFREAVAACKHKAQKGLCPAAPASSPSPAPAPTPAPTSSSSSSGGAGS